MTKQNKVYSLFLLVILIWAFTWPVNKIALNYMPPLWITATRAAIGCASAFLFLTFSRQLSLPKRLDFPLIFNLGIFQIALFLMLINLGLVHIASGRAAILVYTTPIWVTPIAAILFKEKITPLKLAGLACGISGVLLLFNPWGFNWHDHQVLWGNGMLLLAALTWAAAILISRFSTWHNSPMALLAWQLLLATFLLTIAACCLEPHPVIHWSVFLILCLIYQGLLGTFFAYWGAITIGKELPSITTSLGFLGVPVLNLFLSSLLLHERLTLTTLSSLGLIMLGLVCLALSNRKRRPKSVYELID